MSYYIAALFKHQLVLGIDRLRIQWEKGADGAAIIKTRDVEMKFFKISNNAFFLPPASGLIGDQIFRFLRKEFGDSPIPVKRFIDGRFQIAFRKGVMEAAKKGRTLTQAFLDENGWTEEIFDNPNFNAIDSYVVGMDDLGKPTIIDLRENFEFQVYQGPGTIVGCSQSPDIDRLIGKYTKLLSRVANHSWLYKLPPSFVMEFQRRMFRVVFKKILRFVANQDYRVGEIFDLVHIQV